MKVFSGTVAFVKALIVVSKAVTGAPRIHGLEFIHCDHIKINAGTYEARRCLRASAPAGS